MRNIVAKQDDHHELHDDHHDEVKITYTKPPRSHSTGRTIAIGIFAVVMLIVAAIIGYYVARTTTTNCETIVSSAQGPDASYNKWNEILPNGPRPPGRLAPALDNLGDKLYVFGGCYGSDPLKINYTSYNDMWVYTESSDSWALIEQLGDVPSPRLHHTFMYIGSSQFLLFGGFNVFQTVFNHTSYNDLYLFDATINRWTRLSPTSPTAPSKRGAHAGFWADGSMYIFGGFPSITTRGHLRELWKFTLATMTWELLHPGGDSGPEGRIGFAFMRVSHEESILTAGGCSIDVDPTGQCADQWSYFLKNNTWKKWVSAPGSVSPPSRRAGGADAVVNGIVYTFGGLFLNGTNPPILYNDLYAMDNEVDFWMILYPNFNRGVRPPPTFGHKLAVVGTRLVLFGGRVNTPAHPGSNQIWEYTTIPWAGSSEL